MLRQRFWALSALALLTILAFPRDRARAHPPRVVVGVGVGGYYRPYYYPGPYYYPRPYYGFGVYVAPPPPVYVVPASPPTVIVQPTPAPVPIPAAPAEPAPAPAAPIPIRP